MLAESDDEFMARQARNFYKRSERKPSDSGLRDMLQKEYKDRLQNKFGNQQESMK